MAWQPYPGRQAQQRLPRRVPGDGAHAPRLRQRADPQRQIPVHQSRRESRDRRANLRNEPDELAAGQLGDAGPIPLHQRHRNRARARTPPKPRL